jgi:hypothetical protein
MAYTSIRLRAEAVDQLRRRTRQLSADVDRDLSLSEVLALLLALGDQHAEQLAALARAEGAARLSECAAAT